MNKILYHSIQILIKNVFLLNFAHELLSFLMRFTTTRLQTKTSIFNTAL